MSVKIVENPELNKIYAVLDHGQIYLAELLEIVTLPAYFYAAENRYLTENQAIVAKCRKQNAKHWSWLPLNGLNKAIFAEKG